MKKLLNLSIVGLMLITAGSVLLLSESIGVSNSKIIVPILFVFSGLLSYQFSSANKEHKIPSQFQLLQGLGLVIYGLVIAFFPKSLSQFLFITSLFIMMYGLAEIIFSFMILNSSNNLFKGVLTFRIVGGLITAIGAFVLLMTTFSDEFMGLKVAGGLTILLGLSMVIFVNKVKNIKIN